MGSERADHDDLLCRGMRRLRVDEYHRVIEAGVFDEDERVELLEGVVVAMSPRKESDAIVIERLCDPLFTHLPPEFVARCQLPLALGPDAEPEPDVAILDRAMARSSDRPPDSARLVFEVSGESLRKDRVVKSAVYARAGIPEYVIANLVDRRLEVQREPDRVGARYLAAESLGGEEVFSSTAVPGLSFAVAGLFR